MTPILGSGIIGGIIGDIRHAAQDHLYGAQQVAAQQAQNYLNAQGIMNYVQTSDYDGNFQTFALPALPPSDDEVAWLKRRVDEICWKA